MSSCSARPQTKVAFAAPFAAAFARAFSTASGTNSTPTTSQGERDDPCGEGLPPQDLAAVAGRGDADGADAAADVEQHRAPPGPDPHGETCRERMGKYFKTVEKL